MLLHKKLGGQVACVRKKQNVRGGSLHNSLSDHNSFHLIKVNPSFYDTTGTNKVPPKEEKKTFSPPPAHGIGS